MNNKYTYILFLFLGLAGLVLSQNKVMANIYDVPGDDFGVSGLFFSPAKEMLDLNDAIIYDSNSANFVLDPNALAPSTSNVTTSLRIGGSTYAAHFEGNANIDGALSINGAVIGSASSLFTKFPETPNSYLQKLGSGDWEHATEITIDNTKVSGNSDLTDFPFFFEGTYWFLRDWAHGGHIRNSNGYDIKFSTLPSGGSPLDYEFEYYNPNTGEIRVWIRVPRLDYNTDTVIYMFYGNQTISTSQEDVNGTWSYPYMFVNHMEGTEDSSGYNNTVTLIGDLLDTREGVAGNAQHLDGDSDYMRANDSSSLSGNSRYNTISAWIKVDSWSNDPNDYSYIVGKDDWSGRREYRFYHRGNGRLYWEVSEDGVNWVGTSIPDSAISTGEWHHVAATYNDNGGICSWGWGYPGYLGIYVDGVQKIYEEFNNCEIEYIYSNNAFFSIGASGDNGASGAYDDDWNGYIDEVWFEQTERSEDWFRTIYNNQISTDTFYDVVISDVGKIIQVNDTEDGLEFLTVEEALLGTYYSLWKENAPYIYFETGKVGINTNVATPSQLLHIKSDADADNAEIDIQSGSNDLWAIYNDEFSNDLRFWNKNHPANFDTLRLMTDGKVALTTSTVSLTDDFTVHGNTYISQSTANNSLEVHNTSATGIAVYGEGLYGIEGISTLATGNAIKGEAAVLATRAVSGLGYKGVSGNSMYALGAGVRGDGGRYGGFFETSTSTGAGLYGTSNNTYAGVMGVNFLTTNGSGVRGDGPYGVYGNNTVANGAGIRGTSSGLSTSTMAGYFKGDVVMGRYNGSTPVYVDLYDDISAPAASDCSISYTPTQDIKVQRGSANIGRWGGTEISPTDFTEFSSMTSAFVLNNNNRYMQSGPIANSGNMEVVDMSGAIAMTGTDTISFYMDNNAYNESYRFDWEAWEYIGEAGGPNEFIVRGNYQVTLSSGTRTSNDTVTSCTNRDKCIPFITGIINGDWDNDADNATAIAWMSADNTVTVERGGNTDTTIVYGVVVEFTGSNWSVAHGRTGDVSGDTGTINLIQESIGSSGTTYNVSSWNNAIIFHQFKADDASSNQAITDTSAIYYPGSGSSAVDWSFQSDHDATNNQHMVHVLENADMTVTRYTSAGSSQGNNNINISSAGLTDLSNAAVVGSSNSSGTGTAYGRGWKGVYLTSLTNASAWAHRSGNTIQTRVQVINMPVSSDSSSSHFGRMMLETTNHLLYVCTDSGWESEQLAVCGDGVLEGNEVCDDGNTVTEECEDGIVQAGAGGVSTYCNVSCTGYYVGGEACDFIPQSADDCSLVAGNWTMKVDKFGTSYCKNDCTVLMLQCVAL